MKKISIEFIIVLLQKELGGTWYFVITGTADNLDNFYWREEDEYELSITNADIILSDAIEKYGSLL